MSPFKTLKRVGTTCRHSRCRAALLVTILAVAFTAASVSPAAAVKYNWFGLDSNRALLATGELTMVETYMPGTLPNISDILNFDLTFAGGGTPSFDAATDTVNTANSLFRSALPNPGPDQAGLQLQWQKPSGLEFGFLSIDATAGWFFNISTAAREIPTVEGAYHAWKLIEEDGGEPAPVPEPATMLLLGTGLAGMAAARRKRMKK